MSLEKRFTSLGLRMSRARVNTKKRLMLWRKRDAAMRKAELRREEWVEEYWRKPN